MNYVRAIFETTGKSKRPLKVKEALNNIRVRYK